MGAYVTIDLLAISRFAYSLPILPQPPSLQGGEPEIEDAGSPQAPHNDNDEEHEDLFGDLDDGEFARAFGIIDHGEYASNSGGGGNEPASGGGGSLARLHAARGQVEVLQSGQWVPATVGSWPSKDARGQPTYDILYHHDPEHLPEHGVPAARVRAPGSCPDTPQTGLNAIYDAAADGQPACFVSANDKRLNPQQLADYLEASQKPLERHVADVPRVLRRSGGLNKLTRNQAHMEKQEAQSARKTKCQTPVPAIIASFVAGRFVSVHAQFQVPVKDRAAMSKAQKQVRGAKPSFVQCGQNDLVEDPATGKLKCVRCSTTFQDPKAGAVAGACARMARGGRVVDLVTTR